MLLIRESFVAKPGCASKLAAMFKASLEGWMGEVRIMTDVTGAMNHVVIESLAEDMAALTERQKEYQRNTAMREKMKGYTELYLTASREIYQIVE